MISITTLTVLIGYLDFVKGSVSDPKILSYIEKEERAASTIRQQIQFTGEYQNIGMMAPAWQDLRKTFQNAVQHHSTGDLGITIGPGDFEIFADPLFEKTFYNLIDNSLRYGGETMKNIRISSKVNPEGLFIFYEDDGVGIPANEKSRIFERGFGKTGGQGLFLVQEILSITGITIGESGTPGKGCRFELFVPNGMYPGKSSDLVIRCIYKDIFAPATDPPPIPALPSLKGGATPPVPPVSDRSGSAKKFRPAKSRERRAGRAKIYSITVLRDYQDYSAVIRS